MKKLASPLVAVILGLVLGLGTGYLKSEFFAVGADFDQRNADFDEALDVLPLHWSGEPFSYVGRQFSARSVMALPSPPQQPIHPGVQASSHRSIWNRLDWRHPCL